MKLEDYPKLSSGYRTRLATADMSLELMLSSYTVGRQDTALYHLGRAIHELEVVRGWLARSVEAGQ